MTAFFGDVDHCLRVSIALVRHERSLRQFFPGDVGPVRTLRGDKMFQSRFYV